MITAGEGLPWRGSQHTSQLTLALLVCREGIILTPTGLLEIKGGPAKISGPWQVLGKWNTQASDSTGHLDSLLQGNPLCSER